MSDPFASWRAAVAGEKVPMHLDEPWCGYFKMRDRRGLYAQMAPIKRPFVACAIWPGPDGNLVAEIAKQSVPVDRVWPYAAKYPIPHETYAFWHLNERWPEQADAA